MYVHKVSQRNVMYTFLDKKIKMLMKMSTIKVMVLSMIDYHRGDDNLSAIINRLAQYYIGSNNINLLVSNGIFGTRLKGGKDCTNVKYIYISD